MAVQQMALIGMSAFNLAVFKYRYEQAKRDKEARKNQKTVEIKEVRMSLNIDTHDLNTS